MKRDGTIATLASFLGVFLLVVISFGNLRSSLMVGGTLLVGTLWMLGLAALRGTKLNFFNFMALPMTVGIGVDYAINIYQRYTQEGLGSINLVLKRTGMAVFLCSLTTIIGYTTLIVADSQALASLGWLAILGEFTTLTAAMVGLPAVIAIIDGRRRTEPAHHGAAMPTLT